MRDGIAVAWGYAGREVQQDTDQTSTEVRRGPDDVPIKPGNRMESHIESRHESAVLFHPIGGGIRADSQYVEAVHCEWDRPRGTYSCRIVPEYEGDGELSPIPMR